jgi:hypothetical protein
MKRAWAGEVREISPMLKAIHAQESRKHTPKAALLSEV